MAYVGVQMYILALTSFRCRLDAVDIYDAYAGQKLFLVWNAKEQTVQDLLCAHYEKTVKTKLRARAALQCFASYQNTTALHLRACAHVRIYLSELMNHDLEF